MKKIMMATIALLMAISANAQYLNDSGTPFAQNKWYVGASLSGFDLDYHKCQDWHIGLQANGGYLVADNWMITAQLAYQKYTDVPAATQLGAGLRYYFDNCGVYVGAIAKYAHQDDFSDFRPELSVGYAYFLTGKLTVEPEVYYEHSTKSSDYSGFGLRVGFGLYF